MDLTFHQLEVNIIITEVLYNRAYVRNAQSTMSTPFSAYYCYCDHELVRHSPHTIVTVTEIFVNEVWKMKQFWEVQVRWYMNEWMKYFIWVTRITKKCPAWLDLRVTRLRYKKEKLDGNYYKH